MTTMLSNFANAGLADAPVVFKSGDWSVRRSVNTFLDVVSCVGIYQGNFGVQLNNDSLFVVVRGGIQSIKLRYGAQPPDELRLSTEAERDVDAVMFDGIRFTRLLETDRVRMQVLTLFDSLKTFDIDLTDMPAALANIREGCPE